MRSLLGATVATALDAALLAFALGGIAALAAHPIALALLAVWFVGSLALAARRPVRAQAGTVRAIDPGLLVALFALPLLVAPVAAWGERMHLAMIPGGAVRGWAGVAVVAIGLAIRAAAMMRLGPRFDPSVAIVPGHQLETTGLYARVRHPGYAGAWLSALGATLAFGSALGLVPAALMAVALGLRVRNEERVLARHFGEAWNVYRGRTGAFWPRFR